MPDSAWFGPRLRELRKAAGLTQEQLGERIGQKQEAIARWESGKQQPKWESVLALASALGVTCEAFTTPPATSED